MYFNLLQAFQPSLYRAHSHLQQPSPSRVQDHLQQKLERHPQNLYHSFCFLQENWKMKQFLLVIDGTFLNVTLATKIATYIFYGQRMVKSWKRLVILSLKDQNTTSLDYESGT